LQTCTRCNASSPDTARTCPNCNSDLTQYSSTAVALRNFIENPRVGSIRISVAAGACPACYEARGTFPKDSVPALPHQGCSHQYGCRCTYEPVLNDIFP